jgi:hypothetical protein
MPDSKRFAVALQQETALILSRIERSLDLLRQRCSAGSEGLVAELQEAIDAIRETVRGI